MAKNLASVKPVKVWGFLYSDGELLGAWPIKSDYYNTPCTLLTTARYKKLMDVVKAAQVFHHGKSCINPLEAAIEAAEKAGAL